MENPATFVPINHGRPSVLKRLLFSFMALALLGAASAAERDESNALDIYLKPQTMVRLPDGRQMHFFCMGSGAPVAILDAGLGDWSVSWRTIQPMLAESTRVCAFDRAGYGFSDGGPMPRDSGAEARDLHEALDAAGIRPPYILVGHSYAGMNALLFAFRAPKDVAGMLLIDPSFAYQDRRMGSPVSTDNDLKECLKLAESGKLHAGMAEAEKGFDCVNPGRDDWSKVMSAKLVEESTRPAYFRALLSERQNFGGRSSKELAASKHSLGTMPIVVLTQDAANYAMQDKPEAHLEKKYPIWVAGHDEIARNSSRGENLVVDGAGHYVHLSQPDIVVAKFRELLQAAKMAQPP
jgi:pimeloyl-ACP methyl ester carboxylesterase